MNLKNDMKTLMEGWRLFLVEGQADPKDPKNPELRLPKGPNSTSNDEDDLEEGHEDPAPDNVYQYDHELDGGKNWAT